jgi:hypothetical protein
MMRASVKLSLTGVLVAGTLAFSAVGAYAMGGGYGPDAFIGIIGGSPAQAYGYPNGGNNQGGYSTGGGYQANTGHWYRNRHSGQGGNGTYDGSGYYHGN